MLVQLRDSPQIRENFPLAVYYLGYRHNQEHIVRMHGLDVYQLFYCVEGSGEVLTKNKKFLIEKGQVFVLLPNVYCEYYSVDGKPWIVDIIGFLGSLAESIINHLDLAQPNVFKLSEKFDFSKFIRSMIAISRESSDAQIELSTLCYKLLLLLKNTFTPVLPITNVNADILTEKVVPYIQKNYLEDISLDEIADACDISKGHLCHRFKKEFGQTVNNYIINLKIARARHMLIFMPEKSIKQIATACGFSSASYFGYEFKKIMGISPLKYRMVN